MLAYLLGCHLVMKNYMEQFWLLTVLVTVYHCAELFILYRKERYLFLIKPVVLGVIVLFFLQLGGITNFLMRNNNGDFALLYNNFLIKEPHWLAYTMGLVLATSVLYWFGYRLQLGRIIYKAYIGMYRKLWEFDISYMRLFYGWIIGCIIKLVINHYGAIGHKYIILTLNHEYLPSFVTRLKVFENLSLLFLIMMLYLYYQQKSNGFLRGVVIFGFLFELTFAVTSGARFTIIMLFLSLFLVDYINARRLKLLWVFVLSGVLYLSMTVIASYKDYIFHDTKQLTMDENTIESFQKALDYAKDKKSSIGTSRELEEAGRIAVVGRFNYINELAQMIRYKEVEGLNANDPDFIYPFLTFPVFAVLPKYYLFGKEEIGYGYWATKRLSGGRRTSTAISPIGFTYLAGGPFLVFFVFLLLGVLMRWVGLLINNINTVVGLILYLALMSTLVMFDSVVTGTYINLIRYSLLLPFVLWIFLSKSRSKVLMHGPVTSA